MSSLEDAFRTVLAARLPKGHAWAAWIDGTVHELAASVRGVTRDGLAHEFAAVLHEYRSRNYGPENPPVEVALADLALDLLQPAEAS